MLFVRLGMWLRFVFILGLATGSFATLGNANAGPLDCKAVDGKWSGKMSGKYRGATSMTIKNCRLTWKLPDRRTNRCRYKEKSGKIEYKCSLGSHGIAEINGNRITMKNVFTAARHGAYTVNITRTGQ